MNEMADVRYQLGKLAEAVENIHGELEDIKHRLFGNGRIGVIAEHARELTLLKQAFIERKMRDKLVLWLMRVVWGMLIWAWGVLVGAANWMPKLQQLLRHMGW